MGDQIKTSAITKLDRALATEDELKATLQVDVRHRNMVVAFIILVVGVFGASITFNIWLGVVVGAFGFIEVGDTYLKASQQVAKTKIKLLRAKKASRLLSVGIVGGDE